MNSNKQSGAISFILVFVFTGVVSIFLLSSTIKLSQINKQHSSKKIDLIHATQIQSIALKLKDIYNKSMMTKNCPPGTRKKAVTNFNSNRRIYRVGTTNIDLKLCMPVGENLCSESTLSDGTRGNICASLNSSSLFLSDLKSKWFEGGTSATTIVSSTAGSKGYTNAIIVPSPSSTKGWRSCLMPYVMCLRVSLCQEGQVTCTKANSVASQIIRLGPMF